MADGSRISTSGGYRLSRRGLLRAGLATLAVAPLVAGCTRPEEPSPPPVSTPTATEEQTADNAFGVDRAAAVAVVVFADGTGPLAAEQHRAMYNAWAGGPVASVATATSVADQLGSTLAAGAPPDLVQNAATSVEGAGMPVAGLPTAELVTEGQLANLGALLEAPTIDDPNTRVREVLLPGTEVLGTYDGSMRMLNYAFHLWGWWHSPALFEENDWAPATTWDDFLDLCDSIKGTGLSPIVHPGLQPDYLATMLQTAAIKHGGNAIAVDMDNLGATSWTNPAVQLAAEEFQELYDLGFFFAGSEELDIAAAEGEWAQGRAAMMPSGSWLEQNLVGRVPATFELMVTPHPSGNDDALPFETVFGGTGTGFMIGERSLNKPGGLEFLRLMLSQEGVERFTASTSTLVAVQNSWEYLTEPSVALQSVADATRLAGDNIVNVLGTTVPWYPSLRQALRTQITRLSSGQVQADEFCDAMQETANQLRLDSSIERFERAG